MSEKKKILLVGESWVSSATHSKGFDQFGSVTFHLGAEPLVACLKDSPFALTYMPAHEAVDGLPATLAGLQAYDAILLSDIGANSLLLHPDVWLHGKTYPNRLKLLRDYTAAGGGLVMIGGYLRECYLSHRLFADYHAVVDACCRAWNALVAEPDRLHSLCAYPYLNRVRT